MERLITWLADKLLPEKEAAEPPIWQNSTKSAPRIASRKLDSVQPAEFTGEVGGRIVNGGPGKNVLVRNKYVREDTGTYETLKIIDPSVQDAADADGHNPYDSGRFDRSRSWDRNRK